MNIVYRRYSYITSMEPRMTKIFRVAEAARELGCSERFLREAEKKGKLPKAKRNLSGWRVYTEEDLERLKELLLPRLESR